MTYNHLTISELSFIQNFWNQGVKAYIIAKTLKRSAETIYRVYRFLDALHCSFSPSARILSSPFCVHSPE